MKHHLYSLSSNFSIDTLGPLKEDEKGNFSGIVVVDKFSKFIGLYQAKNMTSKYNIGAFSYSLGFNVLVPIDIRGDGGS